MTASAKSGVGGCGLCSFQKVRKLGKDDASDKSHGSDLGWSGHPAYGDDDNFYYHRRATEDREQVDTDDSSRPTSKTSKAKKLNTRSDRDSLRRRPDQMIIQATPMLRLKLRVSGLM